MVPNLFPKLESSKRMALIGERPGKQELFYKEPFVDSAGNLLQKVLGQNQLSKQQCFLGNVCQSASTSQAAFDKGTAQLALDLAKYKPNLVVVMGQRALNQFLDTDDKITQCRGSLYMSNKSPVEGYKILATVNPAAIFRQYQLLPLFRFDIGKATKFAKDSNPFVPPRREANLYPTVEEVLNGLDAMVATGKTLFWDVEGWCDNVGVTELSFATDPHYAVLIPLFVGGKHYWSESDEILVWEKIASVLSDPDIPKGCQNAFYELFIMGWKHKIVVRGIVEDTLLSHWELFPEFEKNLGFQASIYTNEPYYKEERTSVDEATKLQYNVKDSCVTCECSQVQHTALVQRPKSLEHYRFNVNLIEPMNYMSLIGTNFDSEKAEQLKVEKTEELEEVQDKLFTSIGEEINVKSTKDKQWLLYNHFGYKKRRVKGELSNSTDAESILYYLEKDPANEALVLLYRAIKARTFISDLNKLVLNDDGRFRCSYTIAGTNTGRLSSSAAPAMVPYFTKTGILKWFKSGTNAQNIQKPIRACIIPDDIERQYIAQYDLSGADGWTVAADLAALGSTTMLDDYLYGIKPAKVLLLMLDLIEQGRSPHEVNRMSRSELKAAVDNLKIPPALPRDEHGRPGDWKYLCMKRIQHGTNYGMQGKTLSTTILKDSHGMIYITPSKATEWQALYELRYNVSIRTNWIQQELAKTQVLEAACGIRRQFYKIRYGLPKGQILNEALSFEPQANTTYATNWALHRLWEDSRNRDRRNFLIIQPRIQVHDALVVIFPKVALNFTSKMMNEAFNKELIIHGIKVNIPVEGEYGPNWYETKTPI